VVNDSQFRVEKVQAPARFIFSGLYGFCMFLYSDVGMFEFPINIPKKNPMTSTKFRPVVSPPGCVSPAEDHLKGRRLQLFLNEPLGLPGPDWRDFWDLHWDQKRLSKLVSK